MDERLGRGAAEARGLIPVGTLNLIDLADKQGLRDGVAALHELCQTTFRAAPELLVRFEARMNACGSLAMSSSNSMSPRSRTSLIA